MKFFSGFMTGVVVTLLVVLLWLRKDVSTTEGVASAEEAGVEETIYEMPDDFKAFHSQFHEDSVFQMAHIVFPLSGIPSNADSLDLVNGQFRWEEKDWIMHRPFNAMDGQFEQRFVPVNNDIVIEQITGVQGQYGMQRRFARMSDGWHLIYYAGMNKLR